jgi:hypothetical protein
LDRYLKYITATGKDVTKKKTPVTTPIGLIRPQEFSDMVRRDRNAREVSLKLGKKILDFLNTKPSSLFNIGKNSINTLAENITLSTAQGYQQDEIDTYNNLQNKIFDKILSLSSSSNTK